MVGWLIFGLLIGAGLVCLGVWLRARYGEWMRW